MLESAAVANAAPLGAPQHECRHSQHSPPIARFQYAVTTATAVTAVAAVTAVTAVAAVAAGSWRITR